eukprot:gene20761-24931_t
MQLALANRECQVEAVRPGTIDTPGHHRRRWVTRQIGRPCNEVTGQTVALCR